MVHFHWPMSEPIRAGQVQDRHALPLVIRIQTKLITNDAIELIVNKCLNLVSFKHLISFSHDKFNFRRNKSQKQHFTTFLAPKDTAYLSQGCVISLFLTSEL